MPQEPQEDFRIDTSSIRADFRTHMLEPGNDRIIFSAPFGTGKTTFLKELQDERDLAIIHLTPVNYSISHNEDIFRLIKYDIINELLVTHLVPLEAPQIGVMAAYSATLPDAAPKLLRSFLGIFSILNKDLPDPEKILDVKEKVEQYISQTERQRNDPELNHRATDFMNESEKLLPALENDFITGFIQQGVKRLKHMRVAGDPEPEEGDQPAAPRTSVLVIDDLDRLDPEHTFRLFNVFSAHLDHHASLADNKNKFGFDKVVFVCDIDNIRNIFHSRYGTDTDFSGYIDKFYSQEVYHFDIGKLISQKIIHLASTISFPQNYIGIRNRAIGEHGDSYLGIILAELTAIRGVTLRRLANKSGKQYPFRERKLNFNRNTYDDENTYFNGVVILELLTWIAGSTHALGPALLSLRQWTRSDQYRSKNYNERKIAETFLTVAAIHTHKFISTPIVGNEFTANPPYIYKTSNGVEIGFSLQYSFEPYFNQYSTTIHQIDRYATNHNNSIHYPVFDILYDAFLLLKNSGYLR